MKREKKRKAISESVDDAMLFHVSKTFFFENMESSNQGNFSRHREASSKL